MIKRVMTMTMAFMLIVLFATGCKSESVTEVNNLAAKEEANKELAVVDNKKNKTEKTFKEITICESWGFETGFSSVILGENLGIFYYLSNFYESLVNYEDGEIVPGLAKRWEVDGNAITFYLRKGVKFSDGVAFNAEVVKKNFEMIPKMLGEMYVGLFGRILTIVDDVDVVDDYTVKIKLTQPYYGALQELAMLRPMAMMSPNAFTADGASEELLSATMGTGPYMLDSIVEGQSYTFVKNPYYWGDEPDVDQFTVKIIPDNQSKILALRSGEIDMIIGSNKISYDSYIELSNDKKYGGKISEADIKTRFIAFNTKAAPFDDENVRLAAAYAMDKEGICNNLLNGIEGKADTLLSPLMPYCDVNLTAYEYDMKKAKALLEEAGWVDSDNDGIREKDGQKLQGEIIYRSKMGVEEDIVLTYVSALREIGFDLSTSGLEMVTWYMDLAQGNFTIGYNETYGIPYDPYSSVHNMSSMSSDPAAQYVMPPNSKIDDKINELLSMDNENKINETYDYILRYVHENMGSIPISYMKELVLFNNQKVSDYTFNGQPSNIDVSGVTMK